jgi:hypothetical protein
MGILPLHRSPLVGTLIENKEYMSLLSNCQMQVAMQVFSSMPFLVIPVQKSAGMTSESL